MRLPVRRRPRAVPERSLLGPRDLVAESAAGILQRPGRSVLTVLGTVVGIAAFVAILGLTTTASGQIGSSFDELKQKTVTVTDVGDGLPHDKDDPARVSFPADADQRVGRIDGVQAAGVHWHLRLDQARVSGTPLLTANAARSTSGLPVYAVSPGLFDAAQATVGQGALFNAFHQQRKERVAVLGASAAARLGITQLQAHPAVFINGTAFTVVGIVSDTVQLPELLLSVLLPSTTADGLYGAPAPSEPAQMLVRVRPGAAQVVADQVAVALRPDQPQLLQAIAPPDPHSLHDQVSNDLTGLLLALAGVSLAVGAVGIMNTTLVAVIERVSEIGLRRSLGARPWHIAAQFLTETATLGILGGLVGTSIGVLVVLAVAIAKQWTALLSPVLVLPAPLLGLVVGAVAGLYPAIRAARIEPLEALRR